MKKILLTTLLGTLCFGTLTACGQSNDTIQQVPQETSVTLPENVAESEPEEIITSNDHSIYMQIINDFENRFNNQEGPSDGRGNAYGFYDLNNDGQDELLIADTYEDESGEIKSSTICGLYTVADGRITQVIEGWSRNKYNVYEDGYILNIASSGNADYDETVFKLNANGELETVDISHDSLIQELKIDYIQLQLESPENIQETIPSDNELSTSAGSFDEILSRVKIVILDGIVSYETRPDQIEEEFSDLGNGIVWLLVHREQGAYTLDFFYREYDIDNDGEDELLLARGISPSQVEPIAIYNLGEEPIVGDALYNYSFPNDVNSESPNWIYINPEN